MMAMSFLMSDLLVELVGIFLALMLLTLQLSNLFKSLIKFSTVLRERDFTNFSKRSCSLFNSFL